jgi:hypothetical protein
VTLSYSVDAAGGGNEHLVVEDGIEYSQGAEGRRELLGASPEKLIDLAVFSESPGE